MRSSPSAFFCIAVFAAAALAAGAQTAAPEPAGEGLYLRTALDVAAEYTYRSADEMVEPYQYNNGIDFTRNYLDMPPFIAYSVDLGRVYGSVPRFHRKLTQAIRQLPGWLLPLVQPPRKLLGRLPSRSPSMPSAGACFPGPVQPWI